MSKTIKIEIEDSRGTTTTTKDGPATVRVRWRSGKIGTIVIEDFKLGTPYKTKHLSSLGMGISLKTLLEPQVEISAPKVTIVEEDVFHLIPTRKGTLEVWS